MITQLQDELDVVNVQLVELRTKHELVETQLAVCKQAEVEHIIANSELSARISDEQERATQLEGALAKIQGEHLEVTVADFRQQLIIAKIQGEHLGVTIADLRQQLIAATAAAEQAAAQVAAKDASLDEVSACLTKVRQDAQQAKQTADANLQEQQAAVLQRDGQLVELQSRLDTAVQEVQAAGVESQAVAVQLATVSGELRLVREQHQVNARR